MGGIQGSKTPRKGKGSKVCRMFYLECFIFTSWPKEAFGLLYLLQCCFCLF